MTEVAIRVENLGKLYHIGPRERYKALRDTLTDALYAPLRRLRSAFQSPSLKASQPPNGNDTVWALKDVSFEIKHGQAVGVIGPNGAGKSTLLKILSRITEPTEGSVEIHGRVGSLLEVGTSFHPELTGRENIYLNGAVLGMKRAEIARKFDAIVDFSGVEKFIDTPVKHYSSGMAMRLGFAVAAHLEPEILVVDEVLAVGDAEFQRKCLGKMEEVSVGGRTVLFVSHNMGAIARLCHSTILLNNGCIIEQGESAHVIDRYLSSGDTSCKAEIEYLPNPAKPVQIRRVRLLDDTGRPSLDLNQARPFRIGIEIEANQAASQVVLSVSLDTMGGMRICDSLSADEMRQYISLQTGGICQAEVEFPGNLLNEGSYKIRVGVGSRNDPPASHDAYWSFVFRINNLGNFSSYIGTKYPGLLLLPLPWSVRQLTDGTPRKGRVILGKPPGLYGNSLGDPTSSSRKDLST